MPQGADTLLLELFAIFVWAKIFGEVFERLSLPAVIGEILAGVVLGPHAAGLISPDENVFALAEIGWPRNSPSRSDSRGAAISRCSSCGSYPALSLRICLHAFARRAAS